MHVGVNVVCSIMPHKNIAPGGLSDYYNSTGRYKILHVHCILYEYGPDVFYLQQLPPVLCRPCTQFCLRDTATVCACIFVRSCVGHVIAVV